MKQNIFRSLMAVTFIATLLLAGCQKDTVTLRIRINHFGADGKVYMNGNLPVWSSSESIWVNGNTYPVNSSGSSISLTVPSSPYYSAFYPTQFAPSASGNNINFTLPRVQYYEEESGNQLVKAPMAAYSTSSSVTFNNIGALLAIKIVNNLLGENVPLTVDSVVVTSYDYTLPLWGNAVLSNISDENCYYQCISPVDNNAPNKYYTVSLAKQNETSLFTLYNTGTNYKWVYIYVPSAEGVSQNRYSITIHANSGDNDSTRIQSSATGGMLRHGQMASFSFEMRPVVAPAGAVPGGQFTVGENKRVWFSAGNLQWKPTTSHDLGDYRDEDNPVTDGGTWRFAPNQWDFVGYGDDNSYGTIAGSDNNRITDNTYTGWIDLFGWGTSGYDNPNDGNDIYHQPYDYFKESTKVNANNYYGYGPTVTSSTSTISFPCLEGDPYSNYDWGVYNTITYNGVAVSTSTVKWRTLTSEEWGWLLGINSTTSKNRYYPGLHVCFSPADYVTLDNNTIHGILVYDDAHLGSSFSLTDADNSTDKPVCCTLRQTQTGTGIPDGCVFLPVTSYRYYNSANGGSYQVNTGYLYKGFYWSTTALSYKNAYFAELTNNGNGGATIGNGLRCDGRAVRLVTPVQ